MLFISIYIGTDPYAILARNVNNHEMEMPLKKAAKPSGNGGKSPGM